MYGVRGDGFGWDGTLVETRVFNPRPLHYQDPVPRDRVSVR